MAAKDASATIAESIKSIQRQTLNDWELLVVDDGSTDVTAQIAEDSSRQDSRIRLLATPGLGPSGARDAALAEARGRYVAILDADDLATHDRLARQIAALEADPTLAAVASAAYHFVREGVAVGIRPSSPTSRAALATMVGKGALIVWSNSTMCWRRSSLLALDGFDPTFPTGEDAELMNRAIYRHGMTIIGLPDPLVWYRLSRKSLSSAGLRQQRMITRYLELRNRCWKRGTPPPPLAEFLRHRPSMRVRTRWARHDFAAHLYRDSGYRVASGTWRGVPSRVALSAVLHPRYVVPKLWKQRLRGGWRSS